MKHYIIDGNNVIGKMRQLNSLQKKDKQAAREKFAFTVDRYFMGKKLKVTLHFDGFASDPIRLNHTKIIYSEKLTADEKIRDQISGIKNRKNVVLVTSDNALADFGRKCSCTIVKSEVFAVQMLKDGEQNEEASRIKEIDDAEEFKKLFGA